MSIQSVYVARIDGRQTVLVNIDILTWEAYLYLARLRGILCIEHHIALLVHLCHARQWVGTQ